MLRYGLSLLLAGLGATCTPTVPDNKPRLVGGPCEGCEAVFEFGTTPLAAVDTLPDFQQAGPQLKLTGTIYKADGKTPAQGVILYIYHTDQAGLYTPVAQAEGWARRHGAARGWVKTGPDGHYTFYTLKPGSYPNRAAPAHIHPTILEPSGRYYWLTDYYFAGDPLLTSKEISPPAPRGGSSGLMSLTKSGDLWVGTRDITLGKNVVPYE